MEQSIYFKIFVFVVFLSLSYSSYLTFEIIVMPKLTPNKTETIGVAVLKSRGFYPYSYWYWIGVGALFGFTLLLNFFVTLSLIYLDCKYGTFGLEFVIQLRGYVTTCYIIMQLWENLNLLYQIKMIMMKP